METSSCSDETNGEAADCCCYSHLWPGEIGVTNGRNELLLKGAGLSLRDRVALLLAGEVFWTQEETLPGEILPSPPPQKRAGGGLCLI